MAISIIKRVTMEEPVGLITLVLINSSKEWKGDFLRLAAFEIYPAPPGTSFNVKKVMREFVGEFGDRIGNLQLQPEYTSYEEFKVDDAFRRKLNAGKSFLEREAEMVKGGAHRPYYARVLDSGDFGELFSPTEITYALDPIWRLGEIEMFFISKTFSAVRWIPMTKEFSSLAEFIENTDLDIETDN
jgi:hypothetical protein